MKITYELLRAHNACENQAQRFREIFPDGCEPTEENLAILDAEELDIFWLARLLPAEGIGSARHLAFICASEVAHLCADPRVAQALAVVERRVIEPASVSDADLAAAREAAWAAAEAARAWAAAWVAREAAWAAAREAAAAAREAAWAAAREAAEEAWAAAWVAREAAWAAAREAAWACFRAHLSAMLLEAA